MSAIENAKMNAAPFDDETPTVHVTRSFKTTDENKTKFGSVSLNSDVREYIEGVCFRSARWRSFGQLMNDALIHYLNGESQSPSPREIIKKSSWESNQKGFAITETLFDEIDLLVKHGHTSWNTKQEFYICALYLYIEAGFPVMERR